MRSPRSTTFLWCIICCLLLSQTASTRAPTPTPPPALEGTTSTTTIPSTSSSTTCGNGELDLGEQCDTKLDPDHCDEFCKCIGDYVGQGTGICGLCGNGVVDKTEECDIKTDPSHCTEYCTCIDEWVPDLLDIVSGDCTQCGNGVLDGGEECDDDMDPNYCEGCACQDSSSPNGKGECSLACGNGILDEGEDCDPELYDINPGCSAETCECEEEVLGGYLQQSTSCMIVEGYCNYCGDNRLGGKDEECDDTSDSNCVRCQCSDGYEPSPRTTGCSLICGNDRLDEGEMCDWNSDANCQQCQCTNNNVADRILIGRCTLCGNGIIDGDEECDHGKDQLSEKETHCHSCKCEAPYIPHPNRPNECYIPCATSSSSALSSVSGSECCLNGVLDKDEDCEPELNDHCTQTCECESKFEPDLISPGLCVDTCGNGKFEPSHEACDKAMDENCNVECSACNNNMVPDHTGSCTLCGNKHLDAGEQCDSALDRTNCADNCQCMHNTIPSPGAYGTCHDHCGDHIFQPQLEQCEISFENPQHCHPKRCECINQFKPNGVGTCINCGNQVVDLPGENCDNTLDQHCDSALCVCENGFTPTGPTSNCVLANCPNDEETCCGDGKYDKDKEECDYTYIIDSNCAKDSCTCTSPYVLDGYGGCQHHCGDGRFQPQLEMCDKVLDPLACSDDCQSCSSLQDGRVFVEDREGRCTLCGNGIADQHEVCDANLDPDNCDMRLCTCVGKLPGEKGVCSSLNSCECGNNLFEPDSGEMCDGSQHCRENLCICEKGFYPDGTGACVTSMCGDQIVAVGSGEECDGGAHCSSTCKCEKGYTPFGVNGCGDVCGNGIRTGDEQCDPAGSDERTCTSQCRCAANFMPTNPLSSVCIHVSSACGNGMLDASEQCDSGSHCSKDCKCEYGFFAVVSDGVSENKDASKTGAKAVTIAGGYGCNSICGDYFVSADEQCDGGDHCVKDKCVCEKGYTPSKGKSIGCEPVCGDGKVVRGEHCDGGEGCDEHCYCKVSFTALTPPGKDCEKACGNGRLDHNEFCDGGAHCTKECRCEQCHEPDTLYSSSLSPTTTQKNPGCRSIPNCVCDGDNKQHLPLEEKMKKALSDKNSVSEASAGTTGDSTNNVFGTPTIPNSVNGDTPISISGKISSRNANGDTLLPSSTDQKTQGKSRISSSTTLSTTKMKSNALGAPSPNKSSLKTRPPPASPMSIVLPKMNGGNGKNTRKRNSKAGKTVGASSDYNADFPALSGSQTASPPPSSTKKPTGTRLTGTKKASTGSSSGSLGYDTNFPSLPGSRLASSVSSTNAKKKRTYAEVVKGVPAMIQSAAKSAAKITTPSDSLHASLSSLTSMAEHSPLHTVREHLSALLQSRNKDSSATSSDNLTSAVLLETITSTSSPSSPSTMSALRRRFKVNKQKNVLHI